MLLATFNSTAVGWSCFALGAILLVAGLVVGLEVNRKEIGSAGSVKAKVNQAVSTVSNLTDKGVSAAETEGKDSDAAKAVEETGKSAVDVVKDFEGLLKVLPERLRFAGFLILVGALLMSMATVQFGGHSIF
jgi:hypothetical protein